MIKTIRHQDSGKTVVAAKLLTGYLSVTEKVKDPDAFIEKHGEFDAGFVAFMLAWQGNHSLTEDGVIGPATWSAIAKTAPTCSTSKNRKSGPTLAIQILLDGNIAMDAIYGPRTKEAVAAFQSYKGLKVDGICGPKTWSAIITDSHPVEETTDGTPAEDTEQPCDECKIWIQPIDYKQYDSRWGKKMYSNHGDKNQTMANSACGPTSMADIVATVKDKKKTPYDLAMLAIEFGDRTYNSGTAWDFFIPHIMEHFGFVKAIKTKTLAGLKACLDAGGYVVCSMAPGYWTKSGHFICAWMYDDTYVYCNDPASSTRKKQKITEFMKERKQFFCFYPEETKTSISLGYDALTPETPAPVASTGGTPATAKGTEIIDISKHQGSINFDKLKDKVAFVIARAGLGSDEDVRFEEYAKAMTERGIPFGVYCYSYAGTEAKARDEAKKLVARASKYKPLFYVMDAEEEKITTDAIRAFTDELRKQGAARIGCYVAHHRYTQYKFSTVRDLFDFVWIPRYGKNDGTIEGAKKPDYKCDLWQFTSTGSIAGIDGNVDKNTITGTGKDLDWFLGGD